MEILYILVPLGIILLALAIWAFFWAVKNDQFDDMEGPAYSILFDETETDSAPNAPAQTISSPDPASTPSNQDPSAPLKQLLPKNDQ